MAEVSLVQCGCGLVVTSPRPAASEIGDYYPPTYYSYVPKTPSIARRVVDRVKRYKGRYPSHDGAFGRIFWGASTALLRDLFLFSLPYQGESQRLLEIGCGSGMNLRWAKEHGWDVYGLELSAGAVAEAHRQGLLNVQCVNIEDAKFPLGFFDSVLMYHTLEHLYSPRAAIRKSYELLRPGGTLLIGVPKFDSWPRHISKEFWAHLDLPRHLHHFTEPVLVKMIRDSGFAVREIMLSSKLVSFFFTVRTLQRVGQLRRVFTRPQGTLSDVMLVVAEKR